MSKKEKIIFVLSVGFTLLLLYGLEWLICYGIAFLISSILKVKFSLIGVTIGWLIVAIATTIGKNMKDR